MYKITKYYFFIAACVIITGSVFLTGCNSAFVPAESAKEQAAATTPENPINQDDMLVVKGAASKSAPKNDSNPSVKKSSDKKPPAADSKKKEAKPSITEEPTPKITEEAHQTDITKAPVSNAEEESTDVYTPVQETDIVINEIQEPSLETEYTEPVIEETTEQQSEELPSDTEDVSPVPEDNQMDVENPDNIPNPEEPPAPDDFTLINEDQNELGSYGRLFIPKADISVALYEVDFYDGTNSAQQICDAYDSAFIGYYESTQIAGDHVHQGFQGLEEVTVGDMAYIKTPDGIISYICTEATLGYNAGYELTAANGENWV